jgi:ABC-2 type transport system permease protein
MNRMMTEVYPPLRKARRPVAMARGVNLSALGALFWLTLRQHARARKLAVLTCLFLLPSAIAVVVRLAEPRVRLPEAEYAMVFYLLPQALVPLLGLLYACGMIQDEIEEQTLTYLLVRPLPKSAVYLTKLAATLLFTILFAAAFIVITFVAVWAGSPDFTTAVTPQVVGKTVCLTALALFGYVSLFGLLSLLVNRSLMVGVAYIVVFEWALANLDFPVRKLTVVYYFRVLELRWLHPDLRNKVVDLAKSPSALTAVLTVLIAGLVCTAIATGIFRTREFHVKTPEGS